MIETAFSQAMADVGIIIRDPVIADGRLHRFHNKGDKAGSKNGWYVFYSDGVPAGEYGSWKTGIRQKWCAKQRHEMTPAERAENKRRMDDARRLREAEDKAIKQAAREKAATIWKAAPPAQDDYPYLIKKKVKAHGIRLSKNALTIPMRDNNGMLHSLQFIDTEGNKRFLSGGRKRGCYFSIGNVTDTLCIAEGYATAASIHESTGYATACAFDAGNLLHVAQALRQKFPSIKIIICADNDANTPGNPGLTKARKAAAIVSGFITFVEN